MISDAALGERLVWARRCARAIAVARRVPHLLDDLTSIAEDAVARARERYDPSRGSFEAYTSQRVVGAVVRAIQKERRYRKLVVAALDAMAEAEAVSPSANPLIELEDLIEDWMGRVVLAAGAEEALLAAEQRAILRASIDALPEHDRRLIELRYFEELGWNEVAERMSISARTAKDHDRKIRERLSRAWM